MKPPKAKPPGKAKGKAEVEEKPDVELGDRIFYRTERGPKVGDVVSRGEHGVHAKPDKGALEKVKWEHITGHHTRVRPDVKVVDQGDDGMIVEDPRGRRRYVHDPIGNATPERHGELSKALDASGIRLILPGPAASFDKALGGKVANRPGLTLKDTTDKAGHHTKRWTKTAEDAPHPRAPGAPDAGGEGRGPGDHQVGDHVSFKAGTFAGKGEITAQGKDGATVKDEAGREHRVHWAEIGGHTEPAAGGGEETPAHATHEIPGAKPKPEGDDAPKGDAPEGDDADLEALEKGNAAAAKKAGLHDVFPAAESDALPAKASMKHATWEQIAKVQDKAQAELTSLIANAAKAVGATQVKRFDDEIDKDGPIWGMGPKKTEESSRDKADRKYGGDLSRLGDAVRGSMGFDSVDQLKDGVAKLRAAGLKLATKPDNKFVKPTDAGYVDINLNVMLPSGVVGELQLHLKPVLKAKRTGHHDYDLSRDLQKKQVLEGLDGPEEAALEASLKKQRRLYGPALKEALESSRASS